MPAAATDKLMKVGNPGSATTLSVPGYTVGDTSITVGSTSNWSTDTGVTFAIDQAQVVNGVEVQIAGTYNEYVGTVASGTSVSNVSWATGSGNRNYSAGALTRVYIPVSATRENRIVDWGLAHANQDGTLKTSAVQAALNIASTPADYTPLATQPNSITYNGNRSYTAVFPDVNYTDRLSPGQRLRTTRTVAAPTQSASLNGTNQYFSKTSPAGMTFTDDFTVSAWVKLSSYADAGIVSRYNGTSGWGLYTLSTGQVVLFGRNAGGANFSQVTSYQSLPLNKWVHISAQLDMSTFTATTTTSYVMIDGVDVPSSVTRGGTNPTALIQAGNLEIGTYNAGAFFPGKIAQAFVSSAKITQANIKTLYSQGLTPALITANSIISAYSFDNAITDLNTTSANNLTANGSAVATNADSPFGGQADGTISSTVDYGIIQKVSYSAPNTTVTVQVPEGCTIPTSGGVSATSYSGVKAPYGFPSSRNKWRVGSLYKTVLAQTSAANGVWYNPSGQPQLILPAGDWVTKYSASMLVANSTAPPSGYTTLSVGNNSESNTEMTVRPIYFSGSNVTIMGNAYRDGTMTSTAQTSLFLNVKTDTTGAPTIQLGALSGNPEPTIIEAECAYL